MRQSNGYRTFFRLSIRIRDWRRDLGKLPRLSEVRFILVVALIAGAQDCEAISRFGRKNIGWRRQFLMLKHGALTVDGQHVAFDRQTLRGSADRATGRGPVLMVAVFLLEAGFTARTRRRRTADFCPRRPSRWPRKRATIGAEGGGRCGSRGLESGCY